MNNSTTQPRNHVTNAPVSIRLAERYGQGATVDAFPRWRGAALCVHAPIRDGVPTPTRGVWTITAHAYGYAAGTYRGPLRDAVALARLWDGAFADALAAAPRDACGIPSLSRWPQARAWSRQVSGDAPPTGPVDAAHADYLSGDAASPTLPELRADAAAGRPVSLAALARATRRDAATDARAIASDIARAHNGAPLRHNTTSEPPTRERVAAADGDGAEQYPATPTMAPVVVDGVRRVRLSRRLPDGRERLRDADGRAVRMSGDVAPFRGADPLTPILRLWFRGADAPGAWHDVPSIAQLMEWSLDGVAETPDGSRVEPDAPTSWLTLLGVI